MKTIIVFLACLVMVGGVMAANVTITFKDSTKIEEAGLSSTYPLTNQGRQTTGGATRSLVTIGTNYAAVYNTVVRIPPFYDSAANHPGIVWDSARFDFVVHSTAFAGAEVTYFRAVGIDTNMNWGEGNLDGGAALNCICCYDSARTVGAGTCADKLAWSSPGCVGTGDTVGYYGGKPSDSLLFDATHGVAQERVRIYVDTQVLNMWSANAYSNEGFAILVSSKSGNISGYALWYASESNFTGAADSIPVFTAWGHTAAAATGQVIIIGGKYEETDSCFVVAGLGGDGPSRQYGCERNNYPDIGRRYGDVVSGHVLRLDRDTGFGQASVQYRSEGRNLLDGYMDVPGRSVCRRPQ
ncbi:MAG: hypothetical protein WC455_31180 [Dehalococcoidia bacterium]|jgi:hypothetical protein